MRPSLLSAKANLKQHYWVNVFYGAGGIVSKQVFTKRKTSTRAFKVYNPRNTFAIRIHIKPLARVL